MHPFHCLVSLFNLSCAAGALSLVLLAPGPHPGLAAYSVFGGYIGNALALATAVTVAARLGYRRLKGLDVSHTWAAHWLGVANGGAVLLFWASLFGVWKIG